MKLLLALHCYTSRFSRFSATWVRVIIYGEGNKYIAVVGSWTRPVHFWTTPGKNLLFPVMKGLGKSGR